MFGQQYASPVASAAKWIFFAFFGVIVMGFGLGTNFKDATWLNHDIAAAEARRIEIENSHQQALYQVNEQLAAAQTQADIREIQRQQSLLDAQYQHNIQALSQNLAHQDVAFRTWMTVLTILAGVFALTLLLCTTIWVGSRARVYVQSNLPMEVPMAKYVPSVEQRIPNLPEREPYDALDPKQILFEDRLNERLQEIAAEREQQTEAELLAVRMKYISDPAKISGDKRNKLPLAGD